MKKILITGGSGMVGSLIKFGIKPSHEELDILNKHSINTAIKKHNPDVILHLAAMTDTLKCEEAPKKAYRVNVTGTRNLARACKKNNIKLVYMSTCAVFDGKKKSPYTETDRPHPLNVYGKTKLEGEKIVMSTLPDALIIRTGWLFGSKKFKNKFINSIVHLLQKNKELFVTHDRYGSPTYIPDLLKAVKNLILQEKTGTYHIINTGIASYFDISKEARKIGKFNTNLKKVRAEDIENSKVKRSKNESLTSTKMKLRSWKEALNQCIAS